MLTPEEQAELNMLKTAVQDLQSRVIPNPVEPNKLALSLPDGTPSLYARMGGGGVTPGMFGRLPIPQTPDTVVPPNPASLAEMERAGPKSTFTTTIEPLDPKGFA